MPTYLSPGVYVEEVPSAVRPIAGVNSRSLHGPCRLSSQASDGRVQTASALSPSGVQPLMLPKKRKLATGSPAWDW